MVAKIFYLLGNVIEIYTWVCIIRIFLSWFPGALMSPVGKFLSEACDPYLMLFRRFKFTRVGSLDLSPIFSLGLLSLLKNISFSIARLGYVSPLGIGIVMLYSTWQVISFILNIIIVLTFVRFILSFSYKYRTSFFCVFVDNIFGGFKSFIIKHILGGRWDREGGAYLIIFLIFLLIKVAIWLSIRYFFMFLGINII